LGGSNPAFAGSQMIVLIQEYGIYLAVSIQGGAQTREIANLLAFAILNCYFIYWDFLNFELAHQ
jgi:hypothetical protein